jgi:hypothetical protein
MVKYIERERCETMNTINVKLFPDELINLYINRVKTLNQISSVYKENFKFRENIVVNIMDVMALIVFKFLPEYDIELIDKRDAKI